MSEYTPFENAVLAELAAIRTAVEKIAPATDLFHELFKPAPRTLDELFESNLYRELTVEADQ